MDQTLAVDVFQASHQLDEIVIDGLPVKPLLFLFHDFAKSLALCKLHLDHDLEARERLALVHHAVQSGVRSTLTKLLIRVRV
jgi:hypothetical protein